MSISINSQTEIEMIGEEFERPSNREEFVGALVDIQSGSGLIERCTENEECTRALNNGKCKEHGDVEGDFDLRIKGVLDNGLETKDIIVGKELTEKISGISIEDAEGIAKEALDTDAVTDRIEEEVMMQYYRVEGWKGDETTINVEEAEEYASMDEADIEGLVGRLNSLETTDGGSQQTEVN
jgi:replication factor A1